MIHTRRSIILKAGMGLTMALALIWLVPLARAQTSKPKVLHGHVPEVVSGLIPKGQLAPTNELRLAIGLPLRNAEELNTFMSQLCDPASPHFRQYLTREEFTARFGPTEQDYEAVKSFALTNGLRISATHGNRLLLDVTGPAAAVEQAFHITLQVYQHPTEARDFFAPDTEPMVDAALPVADVQGLCDYSRPHPRFHKRNTAGATPKNGSAPDGSGDLFGSDFRNAYAPGVTLTGAGQSVGLLEFDGFYSNDIAAYAAAAGNGRTNIVIQTVLLDGYNGVPTTGTSSGNPEVSLDIEMAMAIAPGLSKIISFEAGPSGLQNDVLNAMLSDSNLVKNLSSSWGWNGGPSTTTDTIFTNMAAVGQSFFNASGDSDAFVTSASSSYNVDNTSSFNAPSSCPIITQVGGTTLTMNGTGASYASETVWNWGVELGSKYNGVGSSGGISSHYSIPSWQTNVPSLAARGGSTNWRNIPDVALTADNVFVKDGNGVNDDGIGGTSCAAPLWAGFMALVNQQAAANGRPAAGFINPAIYAIAAGSNYPACFHDVTTGNNTWSKSTSLFYATNGYDLCTGLGTPAGQPLIDALAGPADPLVISPTAGAATGVTGGPFVVTAGNFLLTNAGNSSLTWSLINASSWLAISATSGTLPAAGHTNLTCSTTAAAASLAVGTYTNHLTLSNGTTHVAQSVPFTLQVTQPMVISPAIGFTASGPVGGPFSITAQTYSLTNQGGSSLAWGILNTSSWLSVSPPSGTLAAGGLTPITVSLTAAANGLASAAYNTSVLVTNSAGMVANLPFTLIVGQSLVNNGGFETGDFSFWNLNATGQVIVDNGSTSGLTPHSGTYFAALGQYGSLGYLSQTVSTTPNQPYLLSLWLDSPDGRTPNQFQVSWNGTILFNQTNLPKLGWTNLQYLVTATGNSTTLQFGFRDDPTWLGLDDVSVKQVPLPKFSAVTKTNSTIHFTWNAVAGLAYQLQYKTNLLQTNWTNLGSPITATTNTLTTTDSSATSPRRFYRLQMLQ